MSAPSRARVVEMDALLGNPTQSYNGFKHLMRVHGAAGAVVQDREGAHV